MSRCYVLDGPDDWRFFGTSVGTWNRICSELAWDLPQGILVVNLLERAVLWFRDGRDVEVPSPYEAMSLLRQRVSTALGLVVAYDELLCVWEVAHIEVAPWSSFRTQKQERLALDKLLRTVIGMHDVMFWRGGCGS
jgi:hypothetical protein